MRQLIILVSISMVLLVSMGCQSVERPESKMDVIIDGGGAFPEFMVGRWKADRGGWEIVFEPDGSISSAVHTIAQVNLHPGQTTEVPLKNEGKAVYKSGKWTVQYTQDGVLVVEIVLDHFRAEMAAKSVEASSLDLFIGPVSGDSNEWLVEWFTYPKYKGFTELYPEGKELVTEPTGHEKGTVTFTKAE